MEKLTSWEAYITQQALQKLQVEMLKDIDKVEALGRNPIMTKGFVSDAFDEIKRKLKLDEKR